MLKDIYKQRNKILKDLGYLDYNEYLKSEEWSIIKSKIKMRKGKKWTECNICNNKHNLDVHHSSYKVIGTTNPGNTVKILCRECHYKLHNYCKNNPQTNFYNAFRIIKKQLSRIYVE